MRFLQNVESVPVHEPFYGGTSAVTIDRNNISGTGFAVFFFVFSMSGIGATDDALETREEE